MGSILDGIVCICIRTGNTHSLRPVGGNLVSCRSCDGSREWRIELAHDAVVGLGSPMLDLSLLLWRRSPYRSRFASLFSLLGDRHIVLLPADGAIASALLSEMVPVPVSIQVYPEGAIFDTPSTLFRNVAFTFSSCSRSFFFRYIHTICRP